MTISQFIEANKDGNVTSHANYSKLSGDNETYTANTFVY